MKTIDCAQGSPEWWAVRRGIPTSSEVSRIITPAKATLAAGRHAYAAELVAASLGWERQFKGSPDTERGHFLEKEARRWIKLQTGMAVREVGFCLSDCGRYGASPDGLLEDGAPVEIKAPDLHTFIKWRMSGGLPDEHKAQVHHHIHVTGAKRCLFIAYTTCPYIDNMLVWVDRDEFTDRLAECVDTFCDELDKLRRDLTGEHYDEIFTNKEQ